MCRAYLDAELKLLASPDGMLNGGTRACVPAGEDRARVVGLLEDYAHHHPEARRLASTDGLGLALEGRFPCR